ncbi:MAG: type II toxin-antitoxin system VapC family toxin [Ardenticatenales bacterium]|nr:type II toxin-antitoxin system VapC family toxin [Ardenticatenales bacterium]
MTDGVVVLDAYALVAFIEDEPGAAEVEVLLTRAGSDDFQLLISAVNLGEAWYAIGRAYGPTAADERIASLLDVGLAVVSADWDLAHIAADFKRLGGISYADCFAAALGVRHDAPVVTGDPEFERIAERVNVQWLPRRV